MTIQWVAPQQVGRKLSPSTQGELVRASGILRNGGIQYFRFSITASLMARLRWVVGDTVEVGFDETRTIYFRKSPGGFKLQPMANKKGDRRVLNGTPAYSFVQIMDTPSVPDWLRGPDAQYSSSVTVAQGVLQAEFVP